MFDMKADWKNLSLKSIQPVGENLFDDDLEEIKKLYAPPVKAQAV